MIKIFVHEISHASEGEHDRDKEFYTPIETRIHIYCNQEKVILTDMRYWSALEDIKKSILNVQGITNHYGYTGDFDENRYRERANDVLANKICNNLNKVTKGNYFEVYKLEPFKITQCRHWDRNLYYDPKKSECCFEITDIFLNFLGVDGYFQCFLNRRGHDVGEILINQYPLLHTFPIIREKEIEQKLIELKDELNKIQQECNVSNLRVKAFCRFLVPYIEKKLPDVNEIIDMYPSCHMTSCYFLGEKGNAFYPLNVVLQLDERMMIHKLIEYGAYKLSNGSFYDARNKDKVQTKHSLHLLFSLCDDVHYNILKKNLKEHLEWSDELEAKYPDK